MSIDPIIRKTIDTGILELCDVINSIPGLNTQHSCEGHSKPETASCFYGYQAPLFPNPIVNDGQKPESRAYVLVKGASVDLIEIAWFLRQETERYSYTA